MGGSGCLSALYRRTLKKEHENDDDSDDGPPRWAVGMLNDKYTAEVPGSVLLLVSDQQKRLLALQSLPRRMSISSVPVEVLSEQPQQPGRQRSVSRGPKRTKDGSMILVPQPEDSLNDPLNWPPWRRNLTLWTLGLYCMVAGGLTPILAAGFIFVARDYGVDVSRVALTTGLYMMGMGVGSVVASPTAILYGKRTVYLSSCVLLVLCSVWCAASPSFESLLAARIVQGVAVSPIECLPGATITEIFFLHEKAFRIGIYTLLLLAGKNLVPLASASIIQQAGWRWVFWIVAIVIAICGVLMFFFLPESFWDRQPLPQKSLLRRLSIVAAEPRPASHSRSRRNSRRNSSTTRDGHQRPHDEQQSPFPAYRDPFVSSRSVQFEGRVSGPTGTTDGGQDGPSGAPSSIGPKQRAPEPPTFSRGHRYDGPADVDDSPRPANRRHASDSESTPRRRMQRAFTYPHPSDIKNKEDNHVEHDYQAESQQQSRRWRSASDPPPRDASPNSDGQYDLASPHCQGDYFSIPPEQPPEADPLSAWQSSPLQRRLAARARPRSPLVPPGAQPRHGGETSFSKVTPSPGTPPLSPPLAQPPASPPLSPPTTSTLSSLAPSPLPLRLSEPPTRQNARTIDIEAQPPPRTRDQCRAARANSYTQALREKPPETFWRQLKPYHGRLSRDNWLHAAIRPFVLLSYPAVLWAAAVYSFSMGWLIVISESIAVLFMRDRFSLNAIDAGLLYLAPFVCSILGTVVAGFVSDTIVQFMARYNRGVYEPEFRLVMVIPTLLATVAGLIGYGWTAQTSGTPLPSMLFFGAIGFGCSLGSSTAITYVLDSYRQYAGEAMVSLNFCKNVLHGMVFSFFIVQWIEEDGSKNVFIWLGVMHSVVLLSTLPMYVFGKRARMWTVRHDNMERFWKSGRRGRDAEKTIGGFDGASDEELKEKAQVKPTPSP